MSNALKLAVPRRTGLKLKLLIPALAAWAILLPSLALVAQAATDFGGVSQFRDKWVTQDGLVGSAGVNRPYTWGPNVPAAPVSLSENYAESPGGTRRVLYLDKARMEINDPSSGFVTTGLAVKELVSGKRQDGDNVFTTLAPSKTQVSGDPVASNPNTPVYASFTNLVTLGNADSKSKPNAVGQLINQSVAKTGTVSTITPPESIANGAYQSQTGHNIARPFVEFMNQRGPVTDPASGRTVGNQPIYTADPTSNVFGLAISEPYWVNTRIAGVEQTVLLQLFERRVLTYNPALAANKVEMGNLGQHYYQWRYMESGSGTPPTTNPPATNPIAGTYQTNIATLNLSVSGNAVTGTFKEYTDTTTYTLQGTLVGNTLTGIYNNSPSNTFTFLFVNNGQSFTGNFNGTSQWCGVKSGPLPVGCGFSGTWNSNFSVMNLTQEKDKVYGTYRAYGSVMEVEMGGDVNGIGGYPILKGSYAFLIGNTLELKLSNTAQLFAGNFRGVNQWCGVRSGTGALPAGCGWSGDWDVNYQGLIKRVHLSQNGAAVTGTQDGTGGSLNINGSLDAGGYTLKGNYFGLVFQWNMVNHGLTGQQFNGKYLLTGTEQGMCGWRPGSTQPSPCYKS